MATKYKIYVNGNNQQAQNAANQQLVQQLAQNAVATQAPQQKPDMRETVNELIKNKLIQDIQIPKATTIQDIFKAPKGQKMDAFDKYVETNPDITRIMGDIVGGTYLDRYGRFVHSGEAKAQRQEAQLQAEQAKALQQLKEQNDLAAAMNSAFNQRDIADERNKLQRELAKEELNWRKEQNDLDRALKREQMAQQERLSRIIHGGGSSSKGGTVTGQAASVGGINLNDLKMTAAERKALTENKTTLANIESGLKALDKNPDAYQWYKGILGPDVANRIDPKGVGTRTQIDNITAVYRKWLTGAQMSDKERKAYERFLPAPTDNYNIVKAKLEGMRGAVQRSNDAILSNYGISNTSNNDPLGLGL